MSTQQMEKLTGLGVVIAIGAALLLIAWIKEQFKNRKPIYELRATIQHIGLSSQTARGGSFGRYNMRSCYVTFELEDGRTVELTAPEELCQNPVGTSGMLVYQGTKCEKFTPDD